METFYIGFFFALISMFGFGLNQIFNKKILSNNINEIETLLISFFYQTIFFLIILFLFSKQNELVKFLNLKYFLIILITAIISVIGFLTIFKSFERINISDAVAIANTYPLFVLFFMILLFNQKLPFSKIIAMLIIFIGSYFLIKSTNVNTKKTEKLKLSKKILYFTLPLITSFSWAIFSIEIVYFQKKSFSSISIIFTLTLLTLIVALIYIIIKEGFKWVKKLSNFKINIFGFFSGLTTAIGSLFIGLSMSLIQPSLSNSISSANVIVTYFAELFTFKKRFNLKQFLSILLILVGIILIVV